mgnify:CR=1 FL=1
MRQPRRAFNAVIVVGVTVIVVPVTVPLAGERPAGGHRGEQAVFTQNDLLDLIVEADADNHEGGQAAAALLLGGAGTLAKLIASKRADRDALVQPHPRAAFSRHRRHFHVGERRRRARSRGTRR